ncbi:MAG: hypothetical protein QM741_13995 [Rudaea sp.]|uniref:hypothetical protein n=1 Tax=Rudaea sp. TaxID=2136325 RepID=UPI0039E39918
MRHFSTACIASIALQGCVATQPSTTVANDNFVGCYKVTSQALASNSKIKVEADMRLANEPVRTPWGTFSKVLEGIPDGSFKDTGGYWFFDRGQLQMVWSNNGLSGFEIVVHADGNQFSGVAHEYWDFEPHITKEKKMFLKRMKCEVGQ